MRLKRRWTTKRAEVTVASGDGGVDKSWRALSWASHRSASAGEAPPASGPTRLDVLRGSLYRFGAVRGRFAKGTQEASFAEGVAPITLIHGQKLIDLLMRKIELLEVDARTFTPQSGTYKPEK